MNAELREHLSADPVNAFRSDFVIALQNHDNVGNHPHGLRIHQLTSPAHQKAAAALVLLYPSVPLIFMGEEIAASAPFRFFVDFEDDRLRRAVDQGRAEEYPHQVWQGAISPSDARAFRESQLAGSDDPLMFAWYQSLLAVRRAWQADGLWNPQNLSTFWEPEARLFGLTYSHSGRETFAISRLFPASESPSPIKIQVQGEVILDSALPAPPNGDPVIEFSSVRAIIGRGTFRMKQ
jgi:hypothetical protein